MQETLQAGILLGTLAGPLRESEIPFANYKVSSLGAKMKETGKVRPLVDLSGPYDDDKTGAPGWIYSPEHPGSVNSTINKDDFPTTMSSNNIFMRMIWSAGKGSLVAKIDMTEAYKHISVHKDDHCLQIVSFGGRLFMELKLTFGASSSPGIFDRAAKAFLLPVTIISGIPRSLVTQHLDDVLAASQGGPNSHVWNFYNTYVKEAETVGIRLDSSGNKEKAQPPDKRVVALGIEYDTDTWTLSYNKDKSARLLQTIGELSLNLHHLPTDSKETKARQSLAGKLLHMASITPGASTHLSHILNWSTLTSFKSDSKAFIPDRDQLKEDLQWWCVAIKLTLTGNRIVHPGPNFPPTYLEVWSDAAGGTSGSVRHGMGFLTSTGHCGYAPWPMWFQEGFKNREGYHFDCKLSMMESLGPLWALMTLGNMASGVTVVSNVDNSGACIAYSKGYSLHCPYLDVIVRTLHFLAKSLGCHLILNHVLRRTDIGSEIVDDMTTADFTSLNYHLPDRRHLSTLQAEDPLLSWILNPSSKDDLGRALTKRMREDGCQLVEPW